MVIVYAAVAVLSVLLMIFYRLLEKKKECELLYLPACVAVVNCGYLMLPIAPTLAIAKIANGIFCFGAAYSVLAMVHIVLEVCYLDRKIWLGGV